MLIPLRQQDPYSQQPPKTLSNPRRLDKLIISLYQHLTQCLGARHQHPALIEKPTVIQHAVIRNVVNPVALRLARWIAEDAREVAEERMATLWRES